MICISAIIPKKSIGGYAVKETNEKLTYEAPTAIVVLCENDDDVVLLSGNDCGNMPSCKW